VGGRTKKRRHRDNEDDRRGDGRGAEWRVQASEVTERLCGRSRSNRRRQREEEEKRRRSDDGRDDESPEK
jgi:hypothetical protein